MSVFLDLGSISDEESSMISKNVTIKVVDPYEEKCRIRGIAYTGKPTPPVMFYEIEKRGEGHLLRLPYWEGKRVLNKLPNRSRVYPSLSDCNIPKMKFRDYQIDIAEEAKQYLDKFGTVTLGLPPAWGKTFLGVYLATLYKIPIMVMVTLKGVAQGWINTFKKYTPNLRIWSSLDTGKVPADTPDVMIFLEGSVSRIPKEYLKSVGVLILDEAHLLCTATRIHSLLSIQPMYIIVETATLKRLNGMEKMVHLLAGEHGIFQVSRKPYRVIAVNTHIKVSTTQGARGTDFTDLTKKLAASEERNDMAFNICSNNEHRKFIVMCRLMPHAESIVKGFQERNHEVAGLFGNKKTYQDSHVLVGTVSKMGVGFDEASFCKGYKGVPSNTMILLTSLAEIPLFEQVRGRVTRSNDPVILIFKDNVKIVSGHITKLLSWIRQTNGSYEEIDYEELDTIQDLEYPEGFTWH